MEEYQSYRNVTKVLIKNTGQTGEAFESFFGFISVFIDGENRCKLMRMEDVEFVK